MIFKNIKKMDAIYIKYSWIWEFILIFAVTYICLCLLSHFLNDIVYDDAREIGIVFGALIAGVISLIISLNNKESEINKYRAKWCEDIRILAYSYIATISSTINTVSFMDVKFKTPYSKLGHYYDNFFNASAMEAIRETEEKGFEIDLMLMNKGDERTEVSVHVLFEKLNNEFFEIMAFIHRRGGEVKGGEDIENIEEKITDISNRLSLLGGNFINPLIFEVDGYLNNEWNKIEYGGFWFRVKRCLMFSVILSLSLFFIFKVVMQ